MNEEFLTRRLFLQGSAGAAFARTGLASLLAVAQSACTARDESAAFVTLSSDEARARIEAANPLAGLRLDGTEVAVSFMPEAVEHACMRESPGQGAYVWATSVARVATSDDRLDTEQPAAFEIETSPDGALRYAALALESEVVPVADFAGQDQGRPIGYRHSRAVTGSIRSCHCNRRK